MDKKELFEKIIALGSFQWDEILDEFKCIGHVWDVYPKYKEGDFFYRGWVFERTESDGTVTRIVLGDEGNSWNSFVCEGIPEVMDEYMKSEKFLNS